VLIAAACLSSPVLADDSAITDREDDHRSDYLDDNYIYDYLGRQDSITVGLGDAPTSNIIIQHPTPWPSYINDTNIKSSAGVGVSALEGMMERLSPDASATTTVDMGPGQSPVTSTTTVDVSNSPSAN
jgi:hypothetical protein